MKSGALVLLGCLSLALALSIPLTGAARQQQPPPQDAADPLAEYPPYESSIRDIHRAGLAVQRAADLLSKSPDSPETAVALLALAGTTGYVHQRYDQALRTVGAVVERHPEASARTLEALARSLHGLDMDRARDFRPAVRQLVEAARGKLPSLPRAQAADIAYQLLQIQVWLDGPNRRPSADPYKAFAAEYAGTDAALTVEFVAASMGVGYGADPTPRVALVDTFVAEHPGTCAAALALRDKASALGNNIPAGQDPTERFLQVFGIARQLEASPYRDCARTAETSPTSVVTGTMYSYKPTYSAGNVDRLLAAYQQFVATHFGTDAADPNNGLGYLITNRMLELYRTRGEGTPALDRFLADLEQKVREPDAVRYLRAIIYVNRPGSLSQFPPETLPPDEAATRLAALHASGNGLYQRKALATLAWLHLYNGDLAKARETYTKYVNLYPQSGYAWVAALRRAQCAAELGNWGEAAVGFRLAALAYNSMPVARVLGHANSARAHEALGHATAALDEYQAALDGWDLDYGPQYRFFTQRRTPPASIDWPPRGANDVDRQLLAARVAELKRTTAAPGADALEHGRWLIEQRRPKDAAQVLADFAKRYRRSANVGEAQYLAHKAQLYDALATLDIEGSANQSAGVKALDALALEPYDFPVLVAKMSKAIVVAQGGGRAEGERLMRDALDQWRTRQPMREPATALEKDVAAIRSVVFTPLGGSVYASARGWNAFSWPKTSPPFLVVNPDVSVNVAGGPATRVSLAQRFPALDNVLFIDTEQVSLLNEVMLRLGGTKRREGRIFFDKGVMEAPNQPMGAAVDVIRFLALFFQARPGHWGGWEFYTYPVVNRIEFMNADRTAARASVVIGYSGCDVLLEKSGGAWKATGIVNVWVT